MQTCLSSSQVKVTFLACICLVHCCTKYMFPKNNEIGKIVVRLTSIWPTRLGCSLPWTPWLAPLLGQPWVQVERWFFLMLINTSSDHCSQASMPSGKIHQLRKKTGEAFISFLNSWGYFWKNFLALILTFLQERDGAVFTLCSFSHTWIAGWSHKVLPDHVLL